MALEDVTAAYVDLVSYSKFATRTANTTEFEAVRDLMSTYVNPSAIPAKKYNLALALLISHYYTLDDTQDPDSGSRDLSRGPLIEETTGDITVRNAETVKYSEIGNSFKSWLTLTNFGQQYLYLMRTFKPAPRVT